MLFYTDKATLKVQTSPKNYDSVPFESVVNNCLFLAIDHDDVYKLNYINPNMLLNTLILVILKYIIGNTASLSSEKHFG